MNESRDRLQVTFVDENGKEFNMSFADFKKDIALSELQDITTEIIESKALRSKDALAKEFKKAQVITVSVKEIA